MATGGGLIGAMIDSAITNSRVKVSPQGVGPFYALIEDVDYLSLCKLVKAKPYTYAGPDPVAKR